jgi:hypothetical protein
MASRFYVRCFHYFRRYSNFRIIGNLTCRNFKKFGKWVAINTLTKDQFIREKIELLVWLKVKG